MLRTFARCAALLSIAVLAGCRSDPNIDCLFDDCVVVHKVAVTKPVKPTAKPSSLSVQPPPPAVPKYVGPEDNTPPGSSVPNPDYVAPKDDKQGNLTGPDCKDGVKIGCVDAQIAHKVTMDKELTIEIIGASGGEPM